jgi:hypothetical protein
MSAAADAARPAREGSLDSLVDWNSPDYLWDVYDPESPVPYNSTMLKLWEMSQSKAADTLDNLRKGNSPHQGPCMSTCTEPHTFPAITNERGCQLLQVNPPIAPEYGIKVEGQDTRHLMIRARANNE